MAKKWIQAMHMKKGALRRSLHVKGGHKISIARLRKAAKHGGIMGRRARLAITLRSLKHI